MRYISPKNILFTLAVFLSIFQRVIVEYIPAFSYYDELLTLFMVCLYVSTLLKEKGFQCVCIDILDNHKWRNRKYNIRI